MRRLSVAPSWHPAEKSARARGASLRGARGRIPALDCFALAGPG